MQSANNLNNWLSDRERISLLMGILNMTPDSFSDGGRFGDGEEAAEAALRMVAAGAAIIDVGGESTRPGYTAVAADEQVRRIVPAIEGIRRKSSVTISVDTTRWAVAEAALAAGANWVNDISAGRDDPAMLPGVAAADVPVILMHRQEKMEYLDVTKEVGDFLGERRAAAIDAGVAPQNILLDPGIGFGKTVDHNLQLIRDTAVLAEIGAPLVVGASRKSFIGKVLNEPDPLRRRWGDAAIVSWIVANGAAVVRVHDVEGMGQVVRMTAAIKRRGLRTED
jgi:dihydropteroate synthase